MADIEGVRQALGPDASRARHQLGGFLGSCTPRAIRRAALLAVVGAAASREFMPRAEANARRQATPEQWAAYRALWDGSLADDESFRRPSTRSARSTSSTSASPSLASTRAPRRATGWPCGGSSSSTSTRATTAVPSCPRIAPHAGRGRPPRLDLPCGSGRGGPPRGALLDPGDLRAQRPLAPGRRARGLRAAAGALLRPRLSGYFPVHRTAFSDWYTPAKVGIGTKPS